MEPLSPANPPIPIVFLPGGGGKSSFWKPVADRLWRFGAPIVLGYPGFGDVPTDSTIGSLEDLYDSILGILPPTFVLVAQSMGNVFALRMALEHPDRIHKMVLCAVTGGIDVAKLGAQNWRDEFTSEFPHYPSWFADDVTDMSASISLIRCPTLIISGDADPLSPIAVGDFLRNQIPMSSHVIIEGGTHTMPIDDPERIALEVKLFLATSPERRRKGASGIGRN